MKYLLCSSGGNDTHLFPFSTSGRSRSQMESQSGVTSTTTIDEEVSRDSH